MKFFSMLVLLSSVAFAQQGNLENRSDQELQDMAIRIARKVKRLTEQNAGGLSRQDLIKLVRQLRGARRIIRRGGRVGPVVIEVPACKDNPNAQLKQASRDEIAAFAQDYRGMNIFRGEVNGFVQSWMQNYPCEDVKDYQEDYKRVRNFHSRATGFPRFSIRVNQMAKESIDRFCSQVEIVNEFNALKSTYLSQGLSRLEAAGKAAKEVSTKAFACDRKADAFTRARGVQPTNPGPIGPVVCSQDQANVRDEAYEQVMQGLTDPSFELKKESAQRIAQHWLDNYPCSDAESFSTDFAQLLEYNDFYLGLDTDSTPVLDWMIQSIDLYCSEFSIGSEYLDEEIRLADGNLPIDEAVQKARQFAENKVLACDRKKVAFEQDTTSNGE